MAYNPIHDYRAKDALPSGNDQKVIRGADLSDEFDGISTAITAAEARVDDLETRATNTEQSTSQNATDIANVTNRVGALEAIPERIRASLFYQNGIKTSHNILPNGVIKSPDNQYATRVLFASALGGNTPDHYSFTVTALSDSNPMLCTVLKTDNNFIDFSTLLWDGSGWTYAVGGVVNFSLTVIDMDS